MKKMNNKGFLMVEALIVSTFVVSVLIYFFVQFKKVDESFELSYSYNTVNGLYAVNNISDYLDNLYEQNSDFKNLIDGQVISPVISKTTVVYKVIYDSDTATSDLVCDTYCSNLMQSLNVKKAILASGDLNFLIANTDGDNFFTEKMRDFIKQEISRNLYQADYKILVQFNDDTFASLDKVFEKAYIRPRIFDRSVTATTTTITIKYSLVNMKEGATIGCKYGTSSNNVENNSNVSINLENQTCTISNLNFNTTYYYSLGINDNYNEPKPVATDTPRIIARNVKTTPTTIKISYELEKVEVDVTIGCKYGKSQNSLGSSNVSFDYDKQEITITNLDHQTKYYYSLNLTSDNGSYETDLYEATTDFLILAYKKRLCTEAGNYGTVYMNPANLTQECNSSVYNATTNPNGYKSATNTRSGCMRWYIYDNNADNGSSIKMILDHNAYARILYSTSGITKINGHDCSSSAQDGTGEGFNCFLNSLIEKLIVDNNWQMKSGTTQGIIEVANITRPEVVACGGVNSNDDFSPKTSHAWLYNMVYKCVTDNKGCLVEDNNESYTTIINSTSTYGKGRTVGYWIQTPNSGTPGKWYDVCRGGICSRYPLREYNNSSYVSDTAAYGIRPVVTIPKSWLSQEDINSMSECTN